MNSTTDQPHSLEAEKTVLGALLLDPQAINKIRGQLTADDFYDPVYRDVYQAIVDLYDTGDPIDFTTVATKLADHELLSKIGGSAFLANLAAAVPTASHVVTYAETVAEKSRLRSLIAAGQQITAIGYKVDAPFTEKLQQAELKLFELSKGSQNGKPLLLAEALDERYAEIAELQQSGDDSQLRRVKSGLSNIDYYTNGFAPGALYILAGRPSMGKTALALGIAQHAAGKDKKQTLFFSLEMSTAELSDRVAASQIGVSAWKIEKGDLTDRQVQQIGTSVENVKPWPLYIDDDHDTSLSNLRTKALEHKMEHGLDFIVIDYLQLVELPHGMRPKENFHQEISIISRGLKKLARELEVPILALSQLNRSVESTPQSIPQLSHLRESGKIEEDAHLVILLWREGYYNEDCEQPDMTTAFIRKNRQGPIGTAELMFNKKLMTFSPLDKLHEESHANETT